MATLMFRRRCRRRPATKSNDGNAREHFQEPILQVMRLPVPVVPRSPNRGAAGKSTKTANDYLAAVKGFTRWLWRDKRTGVNALAGLSQLANGETDLRHARREFQPDELQRLLDAARTSPHSIRNLSGIDRHFLYLTACATGFRASATRIRGSTILPPRSNRCRSR
jgi:integrase